MKIVNTILEKRYIGYTETYEFSRFKKLEFKLK